MTSPLPLDPKLTDKEWIAFPGGELEAPRPRALCPDCRKTRRHAASLARQTLCFRCYRLDLDRQNGIKAAAELNTASEARFQATLPFEPVDRVRLMQLRASRSLARVQERGGAGRFTNRRRQAQISARHALERIADGLRSRQSVATSAQRGDLAHAAEIQLPDSWLPYAVGR
jgi:hypothetical protein